MYAHQVIEAINRRQLRGKNFLLGLINSAKKIHVGNTSTLSLATASLVGKNLFWDHADHCRLPFKTCWFDFIADDPLINLTGRKTITKRGILCHELTEGLIVAVIFFYDQALGWTVSPVMWMIAVNRHFFTFKADLRQIFGGDIGSDDDLQKLNILGIPPFIPHKGFVLSKNTTAEASWIPFLRKMAIDDHYELMILQATLMLLNCKNVITIDHHAPARLNAKRRRQGKQELFSYRTIQIEVPSRRYMSRHSAETGDGQSRRMHLCRGHFKVFKADAPLFGKCVGMYWWQAFVRGVGAEPLPRSYKLAMKGKKP